ncbi:RING finger protein-like protein [Xylogone sp. PMI_703]|nr:RING finger protein-like protein [Xylogone sp. PMI_703]
MVLNGLLKSSNHNSSRLSPSRSPKPISATSKTAVPNSPEPARPKSSEYGYIYDEADLLPLQAEAPDLRELNESLVALSAIFPDVQVEVFREMLASFDKESRLAVVTDALLKNRVKWVNGRYRVVPKEQKRGEVQPRPDPSDRRVLVTPEDKFRSAEYKKAVKAVLSQEFKGLSSSTINGVLAEVNYSYTLARPTLITISSKSWRFSFQSFFLRRKTPSFQEAKNHPLIVWHSSAHGSSMPSIKSSGSPELDKELFETVLTPIQQQRRVKRENEDLELALKLNTEDAEINQALHDCECCYASVTFEELSACNDGGHFSCFQCVRRAVNEAVFGQGWQRYIDIQAGSLRCLAAGSDDCRGYIPHELIQRSFLYEKGGKDVLRKLDERLAEDNLLKTHLPLVRCPFCSYAEVDELYLPESQRQWRFKLHSRDSFFMLVLLMLGVGMIPFLLPLFLLFSFYFVLISSEQSFGEYLVAQIDASATRLRRKAQGQKFVCKSPTCGRSSCMSCSKAWTDIHICHESSLLALRTQVELAMSLAIKRTCPRCNTSFVKSTGCNKLTCVCGYQMCYICRKDIGNGEGYRHFCEHFRPGGARNCTDCTKCDLYKCEDDEVVLKKAREAAERRWMEKEGATLSGDDKKNLEERLKKDSSAYWLGGWEWKSPSWEKALDGIVDCFIE